TERGELGANISRHERQSETTATRDVEDRQVFRQPDRIIERCYQDKLESHPPGASRDGRTENNRGREVAVVKTVVFRQANGGLDTGKLVCPFADIEDRRHLGRVWRAVRGATRVEEEVQCRHAHE